MGNREDLLAGAKRCLYEKGYTRTTVRDIAAASGVSMAAIGYHYGSKEALLNAAFNQAMDEWGEEFARARAADPVPTGDPLEQFEAIWTWVLESFTAHRQLFAVSFEMYAQIEQMPQMREYLTRGLLDARLGLAALFQNINPATDEKKALAVGSFYQSLLSGVLVGWMIDPDSAPSGHDLAYALRVIMADAGPADDDSS